MTTELADSALGKTRQFEALLTQPDEESLWEVLIARAEHSATFTDLLILGEVLWGDRFSASDPMGSHQINFEDKPLSCEEWALPNTEPSTWLKLYRGENLVYRYLALEAMPLWAEPEELPGLLAEFSDKAFGLVRVNWQRRVDRLSPANRVKIYTATLPILHKLHKERLQEGQTSEFEHSISEIQRALENAREDLRREERQKEMEKRNSGIATVED